MSDAPITGHDGPYAAPVVVEKRSVQPEWIDYNGHMNVGYYGIAFDKAGDVFLEACFGLDAAWVERDQMGPFILQTHQHFLQEMLEGDTFSVRFRVLDHDAKRLHYLGEMVLDRTGEVTATQEAILMNVSHATRRSASFPDWMQRRFAQAKSDHAKLTPLPQQGATIGLRR